MKSGSERIEAPVYSHLVYDVLPDQAILIERPDIVIVEGLNVLQPAKLPKDGAAIPFVSDFFDFSIYIDAADELIESWYVERFLRLRQTAFRDPASYFHRYATLSEEEARAIGLSLWRTINLVNLTENILPTRQRADLILRKGQDHAVETVALASFDRDALFDRLVIGWRYARQRGASPRPIFKRNMVGEWRRRLSLPLLDLS